MSFCKATKSLCLRLHLCRAVFAIIFVEYFGKYCLQVKI